MRYEMLHKRPAGGSQILASAACRMYERFRKNVETEWEDCDVCLTTNMPYFTGYRNLCKAHLCQTTSYTFMLLFKWLSKEIYLPTQVRVWHTCIVSWIVGIYEAFT